MAQLASRTLLAAVSELNGDGGRPRHRMAVVGIDATTVNRTLLAHTGFTTPGRVSTPSSIEMLPKLQIDSIVVAGDDEKEDILRALATLEWEVLPDVTVSGIGHQEAVARRLADIESRQSVPSQARGYPQAKAHLYDVLRSWKACAPEMFLVMEFGVFEGGTLLLLDGILKTLGFTGYQLVGFDTFAGFPKRRHLLDLYSDSRFESRDFEGTERRLAGVPCRLVRGDITDTIETFEFEAPVVLSFFDTDNYSPVRAALPRVWEATLPGGAVVFDHYVTDEGYLSTIGEHMAADEYFRDRHDYLQLSGTGVFVRR